jgi:hypothetical protein
MRIFEYLIIIFKLKIIYVYFTISYIKDKRMSENNERKDNHTYFEAEDISDVKKVWMVEWSSKFEKSSTNEISNYREALEIFNEKTKEEKNTILYEIQKSALEDTVIKKIPILNSSKYTERKKPQEEKREPSVKKEVAKSNLKSRIIILVIVIVSLLITIYWINIIASNGITWSPHIVFPISLNEMVLSIKNNFRI